MPTKRIQLTITIDVANEAEERAARAFLLKYALTGTGLKALTDQMTSPFGLFKNVVKTWVSTL